MKKLFALLLVFICLLSMCACGLDTTTHLASTDVETGEKLTFIAEFYDNHGAPWLSVEGSTFDIAPNKIKEYYYDSDGSWVSGYTTSSVMSVTIDDQHIETCGSTVLFYDTGLKKIDIELPQEVILNDKGESITVPDDLRWRDRWTLNFWWYVKDVQNDNVDRRIVIVQSQEGDPICMFSGNEVEWDVSKNLPKTTEVNIDGKMLYIHRANFAVIDTAVFE